MAESNDVSSSSMHDQLVPFKLMMNLKADQLFGSLQIILWGWMFLALLPRWKYTPHLVFFLPIMYCAMMYTLCTFSLMMTDQGPQDFFTLQGIVDVFQDPNSVFLGWVHYCAVDLLAGLVIVMDANNQGASVLFHYLVMVPILFVTCMLCPIGLVLYVAIRLLFLTNARSGNDDETKPLLSASRSMQE